MLLQLSNLNKENFEKYGSFTSEFCNDEPFTGSQYVKFYGNAMQQDLSENTIVSYSMCEVLKNPEYLRFLECHANMDEFIVALDGDMVIILGAAIEKSTLPPINQLKAFYVPCGTCITINRGVWHGIPIKLNDNSALHVLCAQPKRAVVKDGEDLKVTLENERISVLYNGKFNTQV